MRYSDLIESPSEVSQSTIDDFRKHCATAIERFKQGYVIYADMQSTDKIFVDDSASDPQSTQYDAYDYFDIWVRNDKSWSAFPDRHRSYICSTSARYAGNTGNTYYAFPFWNPDVAICHGKTLRMSMNSSNINDSALDDVLMDLQHLKRDGGVLLNPRGMAVPPLKTYADILKMFEFGESTRYFDDHLQYPMANWTTIRAGLKKYGSFENMFRKHLDPFANNIELKKLSEFNATGEKEVWFSGYAYFIATSERIEDYIN